jgi:formate hydrogenlyase subunit 6/NADH:ubiquinone oxidoreductase subunit I
MAMEGDLLKSLAKKPATLRYPYEKSPPPKGLRGKHSWDPEKCTGCGMCARVCPAFAIEVLGKGREADLRVYLDRCTFCGQCEESCAPRALKLTSEYELAAFSHEQMIIEFKRPRKP